MASSTMEGTTDRLLQAAMLLSLNIPTMDKCDVLFAVGFNESNDKELKKKLRHRIKAYVQENGFMILDTTEDAMVERSVLIVSLMKRNPDKPTGKSGIKLTDAMKLAGFGKDKARSGTSEYMRAFRLIKAGKETIEDAQIHPMEAQQHQRSQRPPNVSVTSSFPSRLPNQFCDSALL